MDLGSIGLTYRLLCRRRRVGYIYRGRDDPRVRSVHAVQGHRHHLARVLCGRRRFDHRLARLASGTSNERVGRCDALGADVLLRCAQRKNKTGMSITDHLIDRIIRSKSMEPFILIWKEDVIDLCLSSLLFFSHRRSDRPNWSADGGLCCHRPYSLLARCKCRSSGVDVVALPDEVAVSDGVSLLGFFSPPDGIFSSTSPCRSCTQTRSYQV